MTLLVAVLVFGAMWWTGYTLSRPRPRPPLYRPERRGRVLWFPPESVHRVRKALGRRA